MHSSAEIVPMSLDPAIAKPLPPVAWPGLGKVALAGLLALAVMFGGLALILPPDGTTPTDGQLILTLPATVGDLEFTSGAVPRDRFLIGLVVDETLQALGRSREDASMAAGASPDGDLRIFAVAVRGVAGEHLQSALATHWSGMTPLESRTLGGKAVLVLTGPGPAPAYVYRRGIVVYVVEAADEQLTAEALAALP